MFPKQVFTSVVCNILSSTAMIWKILWLVIIYLACLSFCIITNPVCMCPCVGTRIRVQKCFFRASHAQADKDFYD